MDTDPKLVGSSADRMAEERQYLRNDAVEAIGAFRRRREENIDYLRKLTPGAVGQGRHASGARPDDDRHLPRR